jgi:hypothetical protein
VYAVMRVAVHDSQVVNVLRLADQRNGDVYFWRSGQGVGGERS